MKLQVSPLALSTDKGGLYAPRQLILTKVRFMGPAPAENKKDIIWSFVPAKMTAETDEAGVIIITTSGSCLDLTALQNGSFMEGSTKKRRRSNVSAQPASLCRWTRLSSSIRNPPRLSPL